MKTADLQRFVEEGLGGPLRASPAIARAKPALEMTVIARIWTVLMGPGTV
jgi:hypothetical protein